MGLQLREVDARDEHTPLTFPCDFYNWTLEDRCVARRDDLLPAFCRLLYERMIKQGDKND